MGKLAHRSPITLTVDNKILKALRAYSADTGVPMSKLIDKALLDREELEPYLEVIK